MKHCEQSRKDCTSDTCEDCICARCGNERCPVVGVMNFAYTCSHFNWGRPMADNEKLARWQGIPPTERFYKWSNESVLYYPNYLNDDAATMSLLDTLVEKGYEYELQAHYCYNAEKVMYRLKLEHIKTGDVLWVGGKKYSITRREAVVVAVLELIEKEASHDV